MQTMYACFWVMMALFCAEFMFWIVFAIHTCMNKVSREHLIRNIDDCHDSKVYV